MKKVKVVDPLILAANQVRKAYLRFGPVDDGRPEGAAFEKALDILMRAAVEAKYRTVGVARRTEKELADAQEALEEAVKLLVEIRYQNWPVLFDKDGNKVLDLGIGLTADRIDQVLIAADRLATPKKRGSQ